MSRNNQDQKVSVESQAPTSSQRSMHHRSRLIIAIKQRRAWTDWMDDHQELRTRQVGLPAQPRHPVWGSWTELEYPEVVVICQQVFQSDVKPSLFRNEKVSHRILRDMDFVLSQEINPGYEICLVSRDEHDPMRSSHSYCIGFRIGKNQEPHYYASDRLVTFDSSKAFW